MDHTGLSPVNIEQITIPFTSETRKGHTMEELYTSFLPAVIQGKKIGQESWQPANSPALPLLILPSLIAGSS